MEMMRESIFVSSIRTFCRMFFGFCGLLLALFVLSTGYSLFFGPSLIDEQTMPTILPDAAGKREMAPMSAPVILQINVHGVIGDARGGIDSRMAENILLDSRGGMLSHDRVKGILLHMNTPGGTVVDSDAIYRMLQQYKKTYQVPVYAYVEGLCASGGMYIASAADQVYAGPAAVIGSVGVIMGPFFNVYDTMTRFGVQAKTLTQGIDKDMLNPTRPWKEGEDQSIKDVMAFFYHRFVDIVTEARPRLDREKLVQQYGAQVFDPVKAEQLGYIDNANSSRNEALLALLEAAKIEGNALYQVVQLDPKPELISALLGANSLLLSGKVEHSLDVGAPRIRDQFAYLYQP